MRVGRGRCPRRRCALGSRACIERWRRLLKSSIPLFRACSPATPPQEFVPLLDDMAADVRRESLRAKLLVMAETDQRDLLPRIAVPTLLIWGEQDARSPLSVAHQFEQAIPEAQLVVISGAGHVSNLERPEKFNDAVREFLRP
jgi:pimeloyl-ACP methyl ester carboxylesterase